MNNHDPGRPELWKHVHGEAEPAEAEALRADETLRRELEARRQLDARFRRLLKQSEQSPAILEERIAELWEKSRGLVEETATPESLWDRILVFRRPALVALAASLALVVVALTMSPEGLVWMMPRLETGLVRGEPGAEASYYSEAELRDFAQTLQRAVTATYIERGGPSGWLARWTGRQRHIRPALRSFPDGRLLATLEAYRDPHAPPVGTWSEPFANADDFELNAEDWAGRVAEEIIAGSTR